MACGGCGKRYRPPATYKPAVSRTSGPRRPLSQPVRPPKPVEAPVVGEKEPQKSGKGLGLPEAELVKGKV